MEASKKTSRDVLKAFSREAMLSRSICKSFAKKEARFFKRNTTRSHSTNTLISTNMATSRASARTPPREKSNLTRSLRATG